jgi:D-beta-D-heptose 7-phosphate kinase/D-beta-D-heptose 1-phosphate adenosyltransferase
METQRIRNIIDKIDTARILVIGDLMLDRFIRGNVTRISDEAPVPILDLTSEIYRPGGAANAICNINALGGHVSAIGVVGNDSEGKCLLELLQRAGTDISGILVDDKRRTNQKTRIIAEKFQQNLMRIDQRNDTEIDSEISERLITRIRKQIDSVDVVLISDYDEGVITTVLIESLIPLAKSKGKMIVVDSRVAHFMDYRDADIVKVSQQVAGNITGIGQINETSIRNIGQWMLTQLESQFVLITQGKDGLTLFNKNGEVHYIPSIAKEICETTGVADTVAAVVALSLGVDKGGMLEAAILANTTAGIKVGKLGEATVSKAELISTLDALEGKPLLRKVSN